MKIITTDKLDLWPYNNQEYRLVVKQPRLANKINSILKQYPLDYKFQMTETPLFSLSLEDFEKIKVILKVK